MSSKIPNPRPSAKPGYAPHHTLPFVCLACRKSWKLPWIPQPYLTAPVDEIPPAMRYLPCPQCGGALIFVGRYFKTPPTSAVKQWRKVEMLWESDWRASGQGGTHQENLRDAQEYAQNQVRRCLTQERKRQRSIVAQKRKRQTQDKRWRRARYRRVRSE